MTATLVQSTTAPSSRTQKRVEVDGPPELPRKGAHPFLIAMRFVCAMSQIWSVASTFLVTRLCDCRHKRRSLLERRSRWTTEHAYPQRWALNSMLDPEDHTGT